MSRDLRPPFLPCLEVLYHRFIVIVYEAQAFKRRNSRGERNALSHRVPESNLRVDLCGSRGEEEIDELLRSRKVFAPLNNRCRSNFVAIVFRKYNCYRKILPGFPGNGIMSPRRADDSLSP